MVILTGCTTGLLLVHFAWVSGNVPYFQGEALAKRSEVQALATKIYEDDREDVVKDLVDTRRDQCKTTGMAKDIYTERIARMLERYKDLHDNRAFELPSCEDYDQ